MRRLNTLAFVIWIVGSISLQTVGSAMGIIGGVAGFLALWRVNRVATPLEKFVAAQSQAVKKHKEAVAEVKIPTCTRPANAKKAPVRKR